MSQIPGLRNRWNLRNLRIGLLPLSPALAPCPPWMKTVAGQSPRQWHRCENRRVKPGGSLESEESSRRRAEVSSSVREAEVSPERSDNMISSISRSNRLAAAFVLATLIGWGGLAAALAGPPAEKSDGGSTLKTQKSAVTPAQIRDALLQAAAKLVDLKLVVAERGDFLLRTEKLPVPVTFKEVWMHGRSAQMRMVTRDDDEKVRPWWSGFEAIGRPLTSADLASAPGVKQCADMSRELVFADSRPLSPGQLGSGQGGSGSGDKRRTLHSVSKAPHFISNVFVPLMEGDKPWVPDQMRSGLTVVDHMTRQPLSRWRVLGEETLGGEPTVLAEIAQQEAVSMPLKRHTGELSMTQGYLGWFSKTHGMLPVRIEQTMRYGFGGREYRMERRPDGKAPLVYAAADFAAFRETWVPREGSQTLYVPKGYSPTKAEKFDPDAIVDQLLANGTARFPGEREIGYRREWKILSLGPIDPSLKLWFEPQPGAEVVNTETNERLVR
jgi:hypothetical protein